MDLTDKTDLVHAAAKEEKNLLEVPLSGAVGPFDVNWTGWSGTGRTKYVIPEGYDGIRFIGEGRQHTHILPLSYQHSPDGTAFLGPGYTYEFESLTIHPGPRMGLHLGFAGAPWSTLRLRDVDVVTDPPKPGGPGYSTVWPISNYNTFEDYQDVDFYCEFSAEHPDYNRGFAPPGKLWRKVIVHAAGAECSKNVNRPEEGAKWFPDATLVYEECEFGNWYQPHSWRGGAGITCQGTGANIQVTKCQFFGRPGGSLSRCFMVDDDGYRHFKPDGTPASQENPDDLRPANGWVVLSECGFYGQGEEWYSPIVRVGTLTPSSKHAIARGVGIHNCGSYGKGTKAEIGKVEEDRLSVFGNNRDANRSIAEALGQDVSEETYITRPEWQVLSKDVLWTP